MDKQTLIDNIIKDARKDFFNGVGRIFLKDFMQRYQVDKESFIEAINDIHKLWKGIEVKQSPINDNIFLVYLTNMNLDSE